MKVLELFVMLLLLFEYVVRCLKYSIKIRQGELQINKTVLGRECSGGCGRGGYYREVQKLWHCL